MKVAKQIYPLTSLRFFAAFLVVLHHTVEGVAPAILRPGWMNRLHQHTGATVLLFFILSGYVLAVVYLEPGKPINKTRFWLARFARIYPLYFVALAVDAPNLYRYRLAKYGAKAALLKTSISFAGSALLLQQWFPILRGIDFPNWSLSVEALFYLLFPLFAAILWRLRLAVQVSLAITLYLGFSGLQCIGNRLNLDPFAHIDPVVYLPYFVAGIVLLSIHRWIREDGTRLLICQRISPVASAVAIAILVTACAVPPRFGGIVLPGLAFLPGFSLLLLSFALGNRWMDGVFSLPILVLLGEASYALYLLHVIVWTWMFGYLHLILNGMTYFLYVTMAIALSIASFKYLETPARRSILRMWHQRRIEPEVAASIAQ
jgi:peptidoglycan/LPS O-acetylase OafA/YrhL